MPDVDPVKALSSDPDIDNRLRDLRRNLYVKPVFFWDERRVGHIGAGWLIDYVVVGMALGAGVAAANFFKSYFSKAGEAAWNATVQLFRQVAGRYDREKMFFFVVAKSQASTVVAILDNSSIDKPEVVAATYDVLRTLLDAIERHDSFVTGGFPDPLIIKFDRRCDAVVLYPGLGLDLMRPEISPIMSYPWLLDDDPDPKYSFAHTDTLLDMRGRLHFSSGEYELAEKYFQRALAINPMSPGINVQLGNVSFRRRQYDRAIQFWVKAVEVAKPGDQYAAHAHFNIACAESKLGNMDRAASQLRQAIAAGIDPFVVRQDNDLAEFRQDSRYLEIEAEL